MDNRYGLGKTYTRRNFQIAAKVYVKDNIGGTFKYCSTTIYNWAKNKFTTLELDENIRTGSRNIAGQRVEIIFDREKLHFCMYAEHPDTEIPGRIWTIEAEVIEVHDELRFAARVSYSTPDYSEADLPHYSIPRFVRDISKRVGLLDVRRIKNTATTVDTDEGLEKLYNMLNNPNRILPIILISEKKEEDIIGSEYVSGYLLDGDTLASDIDMVGHVYQLPIEMAYKWNKKLPYEFSLPDGGIRTYYPKFDIETNEPFQHPYTTYNKIMAASFIQDDKEMIAGRAYEKILANRLINEAQKRYIEWNSLGHKFYYNTNKELLLNRKSKLLENTELLQVYEEILKENEIELQQKVDDSDYWEEMAKELEIRLNEEKRKVHSLEARIESLVDQMTSSGQEENKRIPDNYTDMPTWIDTYYSDRILLHPRAKRSLKEATFEDIQLVYKCLMLLGDDFYRYKKGNLKPDDLKAKCDELRIEDTPSISDSSAGEQGDTYFVDYNGKRCKLERHLRNGTSRDPARCLRIYYFWDDEDEKIVIGWLPSHLQTKNS